MVSDEIHFPMCEGMIGNLVFSDSQNSRNLVRSLQLKLFANNSEVAMETLPPIVGTVPGISRRIGLSRQRRKSSQGQENTSIAGKIQASVLEVSDVTDKTTEKCQQTGDAVEGSDVIGEIRNNFNLSGETPNELTDEHIPGKIPQSDFQKSKVTGETQKQSAVEVLDEQQSSDIGTVPQFEQRQEVSSDIGESPNCIDAGNFSSSLQKTGRKRTRCNDSISNVVTRKKSLRLRSTVDS